MHKLRSLINVVSEHILDLLVSLRSDNVYELDITNFIISRQKFPLGKAIKMQNDAVLGLMLIGLMTDVFLVPIATVILRYLKRILAGKKLDLE